MSSLEEMKGSLVEDTKDLRLNLGSVLGGGALEPKQRYGIALTCALFLNDVELAEAVLEDGREHLDEASVADARGSAAIMAMNTVYYRTRHLLAKPAYQNRPAGLRMSRIARPATSKVQFELNSMACAALAGCEVCLKSHEQSLISEGVSEDQVHESVRIASVVSGFRTALVASRLKVSEG
jgi:alkyl hydroperoxide reductase subunit D